MKTNSLYLTTGEFAKLCGTTKHTLFHYCDIGLFEPAYTDENGYRFYHVLQYDTFLTITQLRTLGMSLAEIKCYLAERSPQRMASLYQQQEQLIDRQIVQLKQIKERIHTQKETIMQVLRCTEPYFLESQKACGLLCSQPVSPEDDYGMTAAIGSLVRSANGQTSANTLGMICNLSQALHQDLCPCRFYIPAATKKCRRIKPAGTYLTTYHRGTYETLVHSYHGLVSYAQQHQMVLDDWIYAETIIGDWAVQTPQEYIIKVSIGVTGPEI